MLLRTWRAAPGSRAIFYSIGGSRVWKNQITFEATEEIKTPLGKRKALRIAGVSNLLRPTLEIEPTRAPRTFTFWITDDADRIPIRITARTELGDVHRP